MKRPMRLLPAILLILSMPFLASPSSAEWQKVGNEQLPDDLEADSVTTPILRAGDSSGLSLRNSSDQLGIFIGAGGNIGVRESNLQTWSGSFQAIEFGPKAAFMTGSAAVHILLNAYFDGSAWRHIENDYASGYFQAFGGHSFRVESSAGTAGEAVNWIEALQITNTGSLRFASDSVLEIGADPEENAFSFGSPARLEIDADDGNVASEGSIDFEGSAEFGSDGEPLAIYQSPSAAIFAPAVSGGMAHNYASDAVHPSASGTFEYATLPCPWTTPGTRVSSARFVVTMETGSDLCNFSIRRQSDASPGTTVEIVSFGGSDYGSGSGLTHLGGDAYERVETIDRTVAEGEKIWAVVRLLGASTGDGAQLHGVEWTFEERAY